MSETDWRDGTSVARSRKRDVVYKLSWEMAMIYTDEKRIFGGVNVRRRRHEFEEYSGAIYNR